MAYSIGDLVWNSEKARYYYPTGKVVPEKALDKLILKTQANYLRDIVEYTNRLVNREVTLADWERVTAEAIKDAHVDMMRLGRGGRDQTFGIHYLDVANELRQNQYPYFRQLVQDLKDGKLSRRQLDQRLAAYVRSSKVSYQKGRATVESARAFYAVRKLSERAENCPECIQYFLMGVRPKDELPLPMTACRCGSNCKCAIYYGDQDSLLKMRSGWLN
jgi:hypothetical protein